jgi:hypothetical protein
MNNAVYLDAVAENGLNELVIEWCNEKGPGYEFHLGEFTRDILNAQLYSPTSPYRILAHLRSRGVIDYAVISRSKSLYRLLPLKDDYSSYFSEFDLDGF